MAGEEYVKEDTVYSEKIVTDEKDSKIYDDEFQLKEIKHDDEKGSLDFFSTDEEDLDIAIVNDLAITDDDPSLRAFTVRSIVVGIILASISSSVNQLTQFKPVSVALSNNFMLILAYIVCNAWAKWLPKGGLLNPGSFNVKEHTCIYIMVSSANTAAYGTYILSAQQLYYTNSPGAAGSIFLLLATQLVGYGISGQLRPYLVYPPNMIWPTTLPVISLLKTINANSDESKKRTRLFFTVFAIVFFYEFIPQYMFPMLGGISIVCLAKNNNHWILRLFGGLGTNEGMGILQLSFDWNLLSKLNPLVIPLSIQLNIFGGLFLMWILYPVLYYYDVWNAQSFPFLSNSIYQGFPNGTSVTYPQEKVLNADNSLNQTLLAEIGRPQFATSLAINYIFANLAVTAAISHVALFYGKEIWTSFRSLKQKIASGDVDIHMKLMQAYPEVPNWWYYIVYVIGIALNIGIAYANGSGLPWWGVIFAIILSSILSLPLNIIDAISGSTLGLNVLSEMVGGFVLPGYPIANMYFKTLGYNTINQAGAMAKDLKIGHYLKVPPRMTFLYQFVGTIVGVIFNYIVNYTIVNNERDILLIPGGNQFWSGANPQSINSAAITWGAIGPMAMFGPGTQYYIFLWAFIIGFAVPVPGWILHKYFPKRGFNYINTPMFLHALTLIPGTNSSWITVSFIIVLVTQGYIKRRYRAWFARHNYLISAAFDSGTSLMVFFVSMALQGGGSGVPYNFPVWWGNRSDVKYMDQCCLDC